MDANHHFYALFQIEVILVSDKKQQEKKTQDKAKKTDEKMVEAIAEEEELNEKLPFPNAVIVRMIRKSVTPGKQIKGAVKRELNLWIASLIEKISKKMDAHPYTYVDYGMFKDAIATYEKMEEIEREKERLIKYLEKIKDDVETLEREIDQKFKL